MNPIFYGHPGAALRGGFQLAGIAPEGCRRGPSKKGCSVTPTLKLPPTLRSEPKKVNHQNSKNSPAFVDSPRIKQSPDSIIRHLHIIMKIKVKHVAPVALICGAKVMAFDSATFVTEMTTGVTTASGVATAIAGLCAGVLVWKKVAKYFNKAG